MKIKYSKTKAGICQTECPFNVRGKIETPVMVGSAYCERNCRRWTEFNYKPQYVVCEGKERKQI